MFETIFKIFKNYVYINNIKITLIVKITFMFVL